jgi:mannose-6-phosphate isomerase-like protein (cupin superfamily)
MGAIYHVKDAKTIVWPGQRIMHLLVNDTIGADHMAMMLIEFEPNMQASMIHYHEQREEAYLALEGSAILSLNGKQHQLTANTVVFIPPGDRHGIIRTGSEGFKMIEIYAPLDPDRIEVES